MDAKTLLGIGAIGGAIYLATSKKSTTKKTTRKSTKISRKKQCSIAGSKLRIEQTSSAGKKLNNCKTGGLSNGLSGVYDKGIFKCIFMAGGTGSGKSYTAKELLGVSSNSFVHSGLKIVNSDLAFERGLVEARINPKLLAKIEKEDPILWAKIGAGEDSIRGRAKKITNKQQSSYEAGRLGLIVDGTGDDYDKMLKKKMLAEKLGYDCAMIFVNTSLEVSLKRNRNRSRSLPDSLVKEKWYSAQKNITKYKKLFGANFYLVDRSSDSPADPRIQKAIDRFIQKPVQNPIGKRWIANELKKKKRG